MKPAELPGGDFSSQFCENWRFSKLGGYKTFQAVAIAKSGDFWRFSEIQSKNDNFVLFPFEIPGSGNVKPNFFAPSAHFFSFKGCLATC